MVTSVPYVVEDEGKRPPTLGIVVLQSEETLEDEFRYFLRDRRVVLHHTRIPSGEAVTYETLNAMEDHIAEAVCLFPAKTKFDVIGYACTSASSVIGEERVSELIAAARPNTVSTNPATAAKAALKALGVRRVSLLTPYNVGVTRDIIAMFETGGFGVIDVFTFNEEVEERVARITPGSILDAAIDAGTADDAEAVFISCTNLQCAGIIAEAERRLGKPVLSSNLALLWHMLKLANVDTCGIAESRLLELCCS